MKISLLLLVFLMGCAGYRLQNKVNPFSQYGIKTLKVPMFYNHSSFSSVSGDFTREIYKTLLDFKGLRLVTTGPADAVLVGIIESPEKKKEAISTEASKRVKSTYGDDVLGEKREDFYVPSVSQLNLSLKIIVIKHPTKEEIKFFQKNIMEGVITSKVIFNERIFLSENFNLKEFQSGSLEVLGTQNRGIQKLALKNMAEQAARSFQDMILYAF
ncbi:MAG: hypothetical protein QF441_07085 [Bacteriovoracaceae bacterium]|jgi:hypothetical protein|nr:hypothetical protein [Bacteriovoracaceae bacterium]